MQAHRGSQVLGLGQEEDRRVRQEVHVQVRRRLQEVAASAGGRGRAAVRERGQGCQVSFFWGGDQVAD